MRKIILQPCANKLAFEHFEKTVEKSVLLASFRNIIPKYMRELRAIYPKGKCTVWGVEPKTGINVKHWAQIKAGDVAFFSRNKKIFASGIVTMTMHNKALAKHLWGKNSQKSTWEYIYFLSDINKLEIPVSDLNSAVGRKLTSNVQGFNVLNEDKSQRALALLDLDIPIEEEELSEGDLIQRLADLLNTEKDVVTKTRLEQEILRKILHGHKKINTCGICNKKYPVSFLVTAHIKKRARCTMEERKNKHIVMPMCKMGCDELFEKGYISVSKGKVVAVKKKPSSDSVREYLTGIIGNECSYYTDDTSDFFAWHYGDHTKKSVL